MLDIPTRFEDANGCITRVASDINRHADARCGADETTLLQLGYLTRALWHLAGLQRLCRFDEDPQEPK